MYSTVWGLAFALVSLDIVIEDTKLAIIIIANTNNNTADPRKDAKNVLKNDFIFFHKISDK